MKLASVTVHDLLIEAMRKIAMRKPRAITIDAACNSLQLTLYALMYEKDLPIDHPAALMRN